MAKPININATLKSLNGNLRDISILMADPNTNSVARNGLSITKSEVLYALIVLSARGGQNSYARKCATLAKEHLLAFPNATVNGKLAAAAAHALGGDTAPANATGAAAAAGATASGPDAGAAAGAAAGTTAAVAEEHTDGKKTSPPSSARLMNVPAATMDQVNDYQVQKKFWQVERPLDELHIMNYPIVEGSEGWAGQISVLVTYTECMPNKGGGNRKANQTPYRRPKAKVVIRAPSDNRMVSDGTLQRAFEAAVEALKQRNGGDDEDLTEVEVQGNRVDVGLAFDGKTHHTLIFSEPTEKRVSTRQNGKKRGASGGTSVDDDRKKPAVTTGPNSKKTTTEESKTTTEESKTATAELNVISGGQTGIDLSVIDLSGIDLSALESVKSALFVDASPANLGSIPLPPKPVGYPKPNTDLPSIFGAQAQSGAAAGTAASAAASATTPAASGTSAKSETSTQEPAPAPSLAETPALATLADTNAEHGQTTQQQGGPPKRKFTLHRKDIPCKFGDNCWYHKHDQCHYKHD